MGIRPDRHSQAIDDLRSYGRSLIDTVPAGQAEALVGRVLAARGRRHLPRRLLVAMATLGLLAISSVGLAAVSDPAAPGDFLYPFDRGSEWASDLFVVRNRTAERLAEARVLNHRGETENAIEFLQEQLAVATTDQDLLLAAIEELVAQVSEEQGNQTVDPVTPAVTAPGQVEDEGNSEGPASPSDPAPGQNRDEDRGVSPSDEAPGQTKDKTKDNPSVTAPGKIKDATTTTSGASNGIGNGNGGNGNNGQGNGGS
jgi:hypothetical protein